MNTPPPSNDFPARDGALDALFAAARAQHPDTSRAEYGFETRVLARLATARRERSAWAEFAGWCWRLAPVFAVVTLAAGWWTLWPGGESSSDDSFLAAQPFSASDDDHFAQWLTAEWLTPI